jgi:hypothetical protein
VGCFLLAPSQWCSSEHHAWDQHFEGAISRVCSGAKVSDACIRCLRACLSRDPADRPRASGLALQEWLTTSSDTTTVSGEFEVLS